MNQTFQNSAQVLSIGVFFTLMIIGLASTLPQTMSSGLQAHGVSAAAAHRASTLPPVSILFAAFLGYNPIQHLLGSHVLAGLSAAQPVDPDRPLVLPQPDLGTVPRRAACGVPVRDHRLPDRRRGVADARRSPGPRRRPRTRRRTDPAPPAGGRARGAARTLNSGSHRRSNLSGSAESPYLSPSGTGPARDPLRTSQFLLKVLDEMPIGRW